MNHEQLNLGQRGPADWSARVIVACSIIVTALVGVKEVRSWIAAPLSTSATAPRKPVRIAKWKDLEKAGERIGSAGAPVVITEFADLQCSVCKRFTEALATTQEKYKDTVAVVFIHFPLDNHEQAVPAARAAECARDQRRFSQFIDVAYQHQDSLGKKAWSSLAAQAGVRDSGRFKQCMSATAIPERVRLGLERGRALEITGTPTLLINGWRFDGALRSVALDTVIRMVLAGKPPPD